MGRAIAPTGTASKLSRTKHCNGALTIVTIYRFCMVINVAYNVTSKHKWHTILNDVRLLNHR